MSSALVMMATYNGIRFLEGQIRSIEEQQFDKIDLLISDDGSSDGTLGYLADLKQRWRKGKVRLLSGPGEGFAENYRHLILNSPAGQGIYAFADQDDEWMPEKLTEAAAWLQSQEPGIPALYCARTQTVDEGGRLSGMSPLFTRPPSFRNAIVQSIAGANTMVFNQAARDLLAESCKRTHFVSHDWWAYLLVSGAGGRVFYSPVPRVHYRQHSSNLVGANTSWRARMARLVLMAGGRFAKWNDMNLKALASCSDLLCDDARDVVLEFRRIRDGRFLDRLSRLRSSGIHRQTALGQMSLYVACMLAKI